MNSKYSSTKRSLAWGVALLLTIVSLTTQAATFCATTTAELQTDLTTAAGNNEDNTIDILENTYDVPAGGFVYNSNSNHSLVLEGGWFDLVLPDCALQEFTGVVTTLDGQNTNPILNIETSGTTGNITLRYLTFQNGRGNPPALLIFASASTGAIRVENSLFLGSRSDDDSDHYGIVDVVSSVGVIYFLDNAIVDNVGIPNVGAALLLVSNDNSDQFAVYMNNNTIAGNIASDATPLRGLFPFGQGTFTVSNNIVWDGSTTDVYNNSANAPFMIFTNNDVGNFLTPPAMNSGDTSKNPQFIDAANGNYRLMGNSPALDTGENSPPGTTRNYDLDGNPRVVFGTVDMGAYEVQQEIFADRFGG